MRIKGILCDLDETLHSRESAFWRWIEFEAGSRDIPLDRQKVEQLDARGRGSKVLLLDVADIQGAIGAGMHALRIGAHDAGSAPCIASIGALEGWLRTSGCLD